MTTKEFDKVVEAELDYVKSLLCSKGAEYNLVDDDRFQVFKHAAALQQNTPKQALLGMLTKHIISIVDMINSDEKYTKERWTEKITDYLNYGLLLLGLAESEGFKDAADTKTATTKKATKVRLVEGKK